MREISTEASALSSLVTQNSPTPFPKRDSGFDGTIHRTVALREARRSGPPVGGQSGWPLWNGGGKGGCPIRDRVPIQKMLRGFPSENCNRTKYAGLQTAPIQV